MAIIGVAGQARFGKDIISDYLAPKLNFSRAAFAQGVKKIFCETFNVDMDFIERWKVIPEPPPGFDMPVRQALQFIGDGFRQIKKDVWVEAIFRHDPEDIIISDVRYCNELIAIKNNGGINILLLRPGYENNDSNQSESQIRNLVDWFASKNIEGNVQNISKESGPYGCEFVDYFIINNGTLEDLYNKVGRIIVPNLLV
jgi:hypothetical protein